VLFFGTDAITQKPIYSTFFVSRSFCGNKPSQGHLEYTHAPVHRSRR
jgi:hypothetical protein